MIYFENFKNGWHKSDELVPGKILSELVMRYDDIFIRNKNPNYENIAELGRDEVNADLALSELYNFVRLKMHDISKENFEFCKLWLVISRSQEISKHALPYVPHIDKMRFFKAMIYLSDVSIEEGPIHLASVDVNRYEDRRKWLPEDYKEKRLNLIEDDLLYQPVTGNQGEIVFFDTNCPHYAGRVADGCMRKVIRLDFYIKNWNMDISSDSMSKKLGSKCKSIYKKLKKRIFH